MPIFSILIVLYRGTLDIVEKNIRNINFSDYEVILVDNSESDIYFSELKHWIETLPKDLRHKVKAYQADYNGGYTRGNNLAANQASGNYLLFLNPDMEVAPNYLLEAEKLVKTKSWSIICPKIYYDLNLKLLQTAFITISKHSPLSLFILQGLNKIDTGQFDTYFESYFAPGGCFLIKRQLFEKLQGFDENYFMYTEEADLCHRAKKLNEKIVYCPTLIAIHHHSGGDSRFALEYILHNTLVYVGKYYSFRLLLIQLLFSIIRVFLNIRGENAQKMRLPWIFPLFSNVIKGFVMGWKYNIINRNL